jgi:CheY-like chemotaxis protein
MDERTRRMATEPFFSTKEIGKGTGLGLSMVHGLVSQSNGAIFISSAVGKGTKIELWLPLGAKAVEEIEEPEESGLEAVSPLKVLLVDDEDLVRAATADMLADAGHMVHQAHSGPSALAIIEQDASYDVLVTDYAMPLMSGAALIRRARELAPAMPALLVTGYASATTDVPAEVPRIEKPFRATELVRSLQELTSRPSSEDPDGREPALPGPEGSAINP